MGRSELVIRGLFIAVARADNGNEGWWLWQRQRLATEMEDQWLELTVLFPRISTLMKQCLPNSEARSSRKRGSSASAQQPSSAGGDMADALNLA